MPEEGLQWLNRSEILTFEEIETIVKVLVGEFGIESIRLTGGEPLLRANVDRLVARLTRLGPEVAMTTNGATLARYAERLMVAGLSRLNISLDSLQPSRFEALTRRNQLFDVLEGIQAAKSAGFTRIKINCVVMRGVNDDEIIDFVRFARAEKLVVRFIEWMPLDADENWGHDRVVSQAEIVDVISAVFPIEPCEEDNAPARRFSFRDGHGEVGVIASVTEPFCGTCDRIRLTADGQLRSCLFALDEHDLREVLRSGHSPHGVEPRLASLIEHAIRQKWAGHQIDKVQFIRPRRSMSQIGG